MINYYNLTQSPIDGFTQVSQIPSKLPQGLVAIFTTGSQTDIEPSENILIITVGEHYKILSPADGQIWKMTVTLNMLRELIYIVEAFYEHTYLPFEESKILHFEAQHFRAFFNNIPAVMYVKDTDSKFLHVNDKFKEHLGLDPDLDVTGKTDFDIFDQKHAQKAFDDEQDIIKKGEAKAAYEELEKLPDGSEYWALSTKIPIKDMNGEIIGVSGVSFDITQVKQSQKEAN